MTGWAVLNGGRVGKKINDKTQYELKWKKKKNKQNKQKWIKKTIHKQIFRHISPLLNAVCVLWDYSLGEKHINIVYNVSAHICATAICKANFQNEPSQFLIVRSRVRQYLWYDWVRCMIPITIIRCLVIKLFSRFLCAFKFVRRAHTDRKNKKANNFILILFFFFCCRIHFVTFIRRTRWWFYAVKPAYNIWV